MAKKDNFDFETENKFKFSLDFLDKIKFLNKFTESQKKLLFFSAILIVVVVIICAVLLIVSATGGFSGGNNIGGNIGNGGSNDGGDEGGNTSGGNDLSIYGEITGFAIFAEPYRTNYSVGDSPVYTGLCVIFETTGVGEVYVYYEDDPESFTITGFDSSKPVESQTITVTYGGHSDTFTIKISPVSTGPARLTSIRLDPAPPLEVPYGYPPDVTNAKIICEYSDGSTKTIDLEYENLADYEEDILAASPGDQVTIKVVYTEKGITCETSFTVTITE